MGRHPRSGPVGGHWRSLGLIGGYWHRWCLLVGSSSNRLRCSMMLSALSLYFRAPCMFPGRHQGLHRPKMMRTMHFVTLRLLDKRPSTQSPFNVKTLDLLLGFGLVWTCQRIRNFSKSRPQFPLPKTAIFCNFPYFFQQFFWV